MRVDQVRPSWLKRVAMGALVFVAFFVGIFILFNAVRSGVEADSLGVYLLLRTFDLQGLLILGISVVGGVVAGAIAIWGLNWRVLLVVGAAVCAVSGGFLINVLAILVVFILTTNDRDNANPATRKEMVALTLEWDMLAPFLATAKDFTIHTEGNSFTRTFAGSFSDTPEAIQAWLDASPGVTKGKRKGSTIVLKMGGGANYGTVEVSPDGTHVKFRVEWS